MLIFISGLTAGIISGLAMGGGVILIAILTYVTNYSQTGLQSVNLIYYIPTALFSLFIYMREKNIDYRITSQIILWGIIPAIVGAIIANIISTELLRKLFAVYLIIVGSAIFKTSLKDEQIFIGKH